MSLTDYQSAILQHMGIPVFVVKSDTHEDIAEQVVNRVEPESQSSAATSTPLNKEEKQARLSALRKVMASPSDEAPQQKTTVVESAPSAPEFLPLSVSELNTSKAIIDDIMNAALDCGVRFTREQIAVGETLQLTQTHLVLPCIPSELTATQKKSLWQALCNRANSTQ